MTDPARGWSGARRVFQPPFARRRIGRMVDDELRFHIEGRVEQFMEWGMTREQAEAEARRRFGDYEEYRRQACDIDERTMRNRKAKFYRLTPRGRRQLAAELSKWSRYTEAVGMVIAAEGAR